MPYQRFFVRPCPRLSLFYRLRLLLRRLSSWGKDSIRFVGVYHSYQEALGRCSGYSTDIILDRVLSSTRSVLSGDAVAERDGVVLSSSCYSNAVVSGLLIACVQNKQSISILDFGGSLGSSFWQHQSLIKLIPSLRWNIVEQPHFVSAARSIIHSSNLFFYESIDECLAESPINVCLLSGVLQCIPSPFEILKEILVLQPDVIILDRTPYLYKGDRGYYSIQHVPPSIYPASYPSRFFVKQELLEPISSAGYCLVAEFPSIDELAPYAQWLGHVFVRNPLPHSK